MLTVDVDAPVVGEHEVRRIRALAGKRRPRRRCDDTGTVERAFRESDRTALGQCGERCLDLGLVVDSITDIVCLVLGQFGTIACSHGERGRACRLGCTHRSECRNKETRQE